MKVYRFFSSISFLKSYTAKVMFVAVAGIYIPLLTIITLLLVAPGSTLNKIAISILAVGFTLIAAVITMYLLSSLMDPIRKVETSLTAYLKYKGMPNLAKNFDDELGTLMRTVNHFVGTVNSNINEKDKVIKALANDLRAPANNVLTQLNLLKLTTDPDEVDMHLKNIDAAMYRQLKLMDSIIYNNGNKINYPIKRLKSREALNNQAKVLL